MNLVLLRYGELALKGRNRSVFLRQLRRNVRACLAASGIEGEVTSVGQRVYVRTSQAEEALDPLSRVFGLVSVSPVVEAPRDIDAIASECVRQAEAAGVRPGVSFRVEARRSDKTFPLTSPEIDRLAGEAIVATLHGDVDLSKRADVTIGVEVSREHALIFGRVVPAPGGLPLGVEGRVVALVSGGIDSPVAAWMMMKRGCGVIPVHFVGSEAEREKVQDNLSVLERYAYGWKIRPIFVSHEETVGPIVRKLHAMGEARWACIFCKRALLQKAAELCQEHGAHAIVMGDSLGQVASQTLANIEVISHGVSKPILRPLIGLDKQEIVALASRIGTFDISTRSAHGCAYLPAGPVTKARLQRMIEIAEHLETLPD